MISTCGQQSTSSPGVTSLGSSVKSDIVTAGLSVSEGDAVGELAPRVELSVCKGVVAAVDRLATIVELSLATEELAIVVAMVLGSGAIVGSGSVVDAAVVGVSTATVGAVGVAEVSVSAPTVGITSSVVAAGVTNGVVLSSAGSLPGRVVVATSSEVLSRSTWVVLVAISIVAVVKVVVISVVVVIADVEEVVEMVVILAVDWEVVGCMVICAFVVVVVVVVLGLVVVGSIVVVAQAVAVTASKALRTPSRILDESALIY